MKVNLKKIKYMEKDTINGAMVQNILENGQMIKNMAMGFLLNLMEINMKDNLIIIRKRVMEYKYMLMVKNMKAIGHLIINK